MTAKPQRERGKPRARPRRLPSGLYGILQAGALYPTESLETFDIFRKAIADSLGGEEDFIDRMLISDIAEHAWEALRLRKLKASFLLRRFIQRLYDIITANKRADISDEKVLELLEIYGNGKLARQEVVEACLVRARYTIAAVEAEVLAEHMAALQEYDRMIARAEDRRDYHLRELERRHGIRRSRRREEIVELSREEFSTVGIEAAPR